MSFKIFTIVLGLLAVILFALLRLLKGKVKIFIKKTNYYLLGAMLLFGLFGLFGMALQSNSMDASTLAWLFQFYVLGLAILHVWLLFEVLPWSNRSITWMEWVFTFLIMAIGALAFVQVCIYFEKVKRQLDIAWADNLMWGMVLFPVPLLCLKLYDMWQAMPRVSISGWQLPLDVQPHVIEPGKSVKVSFLVHAKYNTGQVIQIDILAPVERTLGETFHYILYRHNVEKKSYNKIEVAEDNSRSKAYTWLFYKKKKFFWWWTSRQYLKPDYRIRQLGFQNGEVIYLERIKQWLHQ
jgi:hypothetical protein